MKKSNKLSLAISFVVLFNIGIIFPAFSANYTCEGLFKSLSKDEVDFVRDWGVRLLKDDDPTYSDPVYHKQLIAASKPGTISFFGRASLFYTKYTNIFDAFSKLITRGSAGLGTKPKVIRFTQSGTDANNNLYLYAEWAFEQRTGLVAKRANLLFFKNSYGGTFGRIAEIGGRYSIKKFIKENLEIPTPFVKNFKVESKSELKQVEALENQAIEFIIKQVANNALEIGGIFIEPITAFAGIYTYRPEFIKRLREVADELRVPIFADEILTGGGRTGKFWASEHYPGFTPDLITFGKGFVVSGVIDTNRRVNNNGMIMKAWDWPQWKASTSLEGQSYPEVIVDNTSRVSPLTLIQSNAILKRVLDGNLVQNAEMLGAYLVEKLREVAEKQGLRTDDIQGVGLLVNAGASSESLTNTPVEHYKGRWTPPISMTKEDVDNLLR